MISIRVLEVRYRVCVFVSVWACGAVDTANLSLDAGRHYSRSALTAP